MGEVDQGNKSNLFVENLWWIGPGFGTFFVVCGILVFGGGGREAKATTMNLAGDDRRGGSQVTPPSDSANAEYGGAEISTPDGLPPGIYPSEVFGFKAYCAVINTPMFEQTEYFDPAAPVVSTVHEILTELGNRVYKDKVVLIQGKEVHVRDVSAIGYYANKTEVCAVQAPSSIPVTP